MKLRRAALMFAVGMALLPAAAKEYSGDWIDQLEVIPNDDSYHMSTVHVVHARVQSDMPLWNADVERFGSRYYSTAENQFRGAMDTVNTASVEGALMYVQAEGINYNTRSEEQRCTRKNNMKYIVFYDIVITQTNETLAEYSAEYGAMVPMDSGRCTPTSETNGTVVISDECLSFNGDDGQPELGPFVGGGSKESDIRAPYPNCWWFSFPNTCPLEAWSAKTDSCRNSTRQGLCDSDKLPDGITCTFNYRILGFIPIDDIVGITSMINETTGTTYANFSEFCNAGGVEFNATSDGVWIESIDFWLDPQNSTANAERTEIMLQMYENLLSGDLTTQLTDEYISYMQPLPSVADLTAENPPCYKNVKGCNTKYGCKRDLYGQLCTACTSTSDDDTCEVPDTDFTFPTLTVPSASSSGSSSSSTPTTTPKTTTAKPTTTKPTTTKKTSSSASTSTGTSDGPSTKKISCTKMTTLAAVVVALTVLLSS